MSEKIEVILKSFVIWIKLKYILHIETDDVSFKVREVWWTSIGLNIGSEQNGKNDNFERPVLILRKFGQQVFLGIPLTTKDKNAPFRLKFEYKKYTLTKEGILVGKEKEGILILNQLRAMSCKRLIRKAGVVSKDDFEMIRMAVKDMI